MKRFRKWFFRFLTGHDMIDYDEIVRQWSESIRLAGELTEANARILEHSKRVIETADKVNEHCTRMLKLCEEVNKDETLD